MEEERGGEKEASMEEEREGESEGEARINERITERINERSRPSVRRISCRSKFLLSNWRRTETCWRAVRRIREHRTEQWLGILTEVEHGLRVHSGK